MHIINYLKRIISILILVGASINSKSQIVTVKVEQETGFFTKALSNSWYLIQNNNLGFTLNNWNNKNAFFVDYNFDTISNTYLNSIHQNTKEIGYIVAANNDNCFRLYKNKLYFYDSSSKTEKVILKFPFTYKGIRYNLYEGKSKSMEGFSAYFDSLTNSIIFHIMPKKRSDLNADWAIQKNVAHKANLFIWVNFKGEIIDGIGKYDGSYNYENMDHIGIRHFTINKLERKMIITQKASTNIQTYNLNSKKTEVVTLNTNQIKGDFSNYKNIHKNDSQESILKILIETPSFDDVIYNENNNCYYVLRSDPTIDTTWQLAEQKNIFSIKSMNKTKKAKVCSPGSPQMFDQFKVYRSKPLFIQVYNQHFNFLGEYHVNLASAVRMVKSYPNYILVNNPHLTKSMFRIYIQ
jgi:hypothetical protein